MQINGQAILRLENLKIGAIDMECYYCKGDLKEGKVPYFIKRKGYQLVLENIPAYVCQQCGEYLLREQEVANIQKLITELEKNLQEIELAKFQVFALQT